MTSKLKISFILNGKTENLKVAPNRRLIDLLREELGLTGTKEGCSIGECGACTVLLNGKAVNSCLILAPAIDGAQIITIEGLEKNDMMDVIQRKFLEHGAIQCGFCTPGMVLSAYALLLENKKPTIGQIKNAISGNLCRCTGYKQIIAAVKASSAD